MRSLLIRRTRWSVPIALKIVLAAGRRAGSPTPRSLTRLGSFTAVTRSPTAACESSTPRQAGNAARRHQPRRRSRADRHRSALRLLAGGHDRPGPPFRRRRRGGRAGRGPDDASRYGARFRPGDLQQRRHGLIVRGTADIEDAEIAFNGNDGVLVDGSPDASFFLDNVRDNGASGFELQHSSPETNGRSTAAAQLPCEYGARPSPMSWISAARPAPAPARPPSWPPNRACTGDGYPPGSSWHRSGGWPGLAAATRGQAGQAPTAMRRRQRQRGRGAPGAAQWRRGR